MTAVLVNKFFVAPFASAGDVDAIPDTIQPSGDISYPSGYGPDYELDPGTDPSAKNVPRPSTNQVLLDVTNSLKQYQVMGIPNFITTSQNLGSAFSYNKYAMALYDDGGGLKPYVSLSDANTALPTDQTKWILWDVNVQTLRKNTYLTYTSTGTPNALVIAPGVNYPALTNGTEVLIIANATNTSATTIAINGGSAVPIVIQGTSAAIALTGGEIVSGCVYRMIYNGGNFVLLNPNFKGLGFGGTTNHNVTGSRTYNTNYTNNYYYPIMVNIVLPDTVGKDPNITILVDSEVLMNNLQYDDAAAWGTIQYSFIVPPGKVYRVNSTDASVPINVWSEVY